MKQIRDAFHYIITIFLIFGSMTDNCNILSIHSYLCIFTVLHWLTNNNKCFLSEYDYDNNNGYTHQILQYFGINLDPNNDKFTLNVIAYLCVLIPLHISYTKFERRCN